MCLYSHTCICAWVFNFYKYIWAWVQICVCEFVCTYMGLYSGAWVFTLVRLFCCEFVLIYKYLCVSINSQTKLWVSCMICLCMSICAWVKTHNQNLFPRFKCQFRAWVCAWAQNSCTRLNLFLAVKCFVDELEIWLLVFQEHPLVHLIKHYENFLFAFLFKICTKLSLQLKILKN